MIVGYARHGDPDAIYLSLSFTQMRPPAQLQTFPANAWNRAAAPRFGSNYRDTKAAEKQRSAVGQDEVEGRAGAGLGLRPDAPAMFLDHRLDDGEAEAGAFEFPLRMQALKSTEQA